MYNIRYIKFNLNNKMNFQNRENFNSFKKDNSFSSRYNDGINCHGFKYKT